MQNLTPVVPLDTPSLPRRRTGKIAKLSKNLRDIINTMLDDGAKYSDIIQTLAAQGVSLNQENISNWHHGGYLVRILNILPRLSHQLLSLQKYQDTRPKPGVFGTTEFQLKEKEREAVLDVIDDILGCKAYRRGSGFKPAPPSPPKEEPLPATESPKPDLSNSVEPFNSIQRNSKVRHEVTTIIA